ncbi:nitronate monooxygenase [Kibdelosporangium philippinense]|uniref:Nitronate monooxygenase n=1 Tax=Kibdelosporangium philippinense TaxID=211113 RepID=A0ABS8Z670_9PSEU|nr:nitronate monooxygenase [Kibdelosporangium philippinense]MCE7001362.1 nitronate monooxygenase [Kibdelosporangium philippinense]
MKTALTRLVGVEHPVVQTGMGWVAGPRLVAASAEAGGLGILASATMTYEELKKAIAETKSRTDKPFGVNLRSDAVDARERIDLLIREKIRVASFARAPKADLIKQLKDAGTLVIPSVGAVRHAEKVAEWGADAVIAQGGEAGGHTGSIATTLLIPSVVDAIDIPVIAAGGFFDGRGLAAALSYGAAGIAMGTRFLLTRESTVPDEVKQFYLSKGLDGTVVTKRVDGVPHRVLRTELVEKLEKSGRVSSLLHAIKNAAKFKKLSGLSWSSMLREGWSMRGDLSLSQVVMAANTPMLLRAGLVEGRTDAGVLAAGQVVGKLDDLPACADVIIKTVAEAERILAKLGQSSLVEPSGE